MYILIKYLLIPLILVLLNMIVYSSLTRFILTTEVLWIGFFTLTVLCGSYCDDYSLVVFGLLILVVAAAEMVILSLTFIVFQK